jgi:hypothetical protein
LCQTASLNLTREVGCRWNSFIQRDEKIKNQLFTDMKNTILRLGLLLLLVAAACNSGNKDSANETNQPIDTSVVGKDTAMADTRRDIELSDPEKQSLPGRSKDSLSDEGKNK